MYKLSGIDIHRLFMKNQISAKEIATYFLKRINTFDPELKSFIAVNSDKALKKADELDNNLKNKKPLGKLAGIPIAIKDNINIKGEITSCGSKILQNYKALFDASVIKYLEEEDAIIIGKTNLDEFAMGSSTENSSFFTTKNPWNLNCVPGGSSGGSAAAVAARLCPIALGTDTGGSIRQPAAYTSLVGFKPTYGRVSRYGLVAFGSSLDQIGPMTANVLDSALIMEVIGKHCKFDATSMRLPAESYISNLPTSLKDIQIGVPFNFLKNLSPTIQKNFQDTLDILKDLGANIIDINLDILKYSIAVYYILATAEASTNLARFDGIRYGYRSKNAKTLDEVYDLSREEGFGAEVKKRIMLGTYVLSSGYHDAYYKKAQKIRSLMINAYENAFSKCDFVAMPTIPASCFEIGSISDPIEMYLQDLFTTSSNLAGLPTISLPSGFDENNKPLAFQLIAPSMHDVNVIRHAYIYEKQTKFYEKIPPLFDKEA